MVLSLATDMFPSILTIGIQLGCNFRCLDLSWLCFIKPTEGRISGIYGSQRILNGVKKNPHGGLDIAAPEGTPIKTMSDGKVLLAAKGLYYTGNIVIIDHGYDLQSMYIHMKDINIKKVKRPWNRNNKNMTFAKGVWNI